MNRYSAEYEFYNENPTGRSVGDCAVRAVSIALGVDWETAYALMAVAGYNMGDMPSSNSVWGAVLRQAGLNVPDNLTSPNDIIQHLMNSGQISQDAYNKARQMAAQFRK